CGNMPPGMIRLADDVAFRAVTDMRPFQRMSHADMADLLRQADRKADMGAIGRMAEGRLAIAITPLAPALQIDRIELPGLADIVAEAASQNDVAIDLRIRIGFLEFVVDRKGKMRDAAQMGVLHALLQREHAGAALAGNIRDT